MRVGINSVLGKNGRDLFMSIIRLREDYIMDTGKKPTVVEMSCATFSILNKFADDYGFLLCKWNEFTSGMDYRLIDMEVILVDDMEGVEVYG